jgi:putative SOS response-associated peptidase YedK
MCAWYSLRELEMIRAVLGIVLAPFETFSETKIVPRFNATISQTMPIVRHHNGNGELALAKLGLIPYWTKGKPKLRPFNARAETIATSGLFRQSFKTRRCLVPADGFYEPKGETQPKQPFFIHKRDDSMFVFARLWDRWQESEAAEPQDSFAIITTRPNELVAGIHDRMPVILKPEAHAAWLDNLTPPDKLKSLLAPYPDDDFEAYPVSRRVYSKNNDAGCIEELK